MNEKTAIDFSDRVYLRELAKQYLTYANHPIMEERKRHWYAHNSAASQQPMIVMEQLTFEHELMPPSRCKGELSQEIERYMLSRIKNFELIGDDKVISPHVDLFWKIDIAPYGVEIQKHYAKDSKGLALGYSETHPISDLKRDFSMLKPSCYQVDREYTLSRKEMVEDAIGDILPVKIKNSSLNWHLSLSARVVELMGLENMMLSMMDYPDEMHALYAFLVDDVIAFIRWQEAEELLTLNNENDYAGSGSYGFTTQLPSPDYEKSRAVKSRDLWGNLNSQETLGLSPGMFSEFIYPYYHQLANEFGLLYYGCCEPVHTIWDNYIQKLPGLRKVSVSPWCDEAYMGSVLQGGKVIYSRKPSPNYIGVEKSFDEDAFKAHITATLQAARGCALEIVFRDIYSLSGDLTKPGRAVTLTRELVEKLWRA